MASLRSSAIPVSDPASGLRITEIFTPCGVKQMPLAYRLYLFVSQVALYVCSYCDTTYSFEGGERLSLEHIIETAEKYQTPYICVTGGEP